MLGLGLLAIVTPRTTHPYLLWNASASAPIGLYELVPRAPARSELAVIRLPGSVHALAVARGYLAGLALLIKPVVAVPGDVVCRHAATVTVNADVVALARDADALGRSLPRWQGCLTLVTGQVFVLSTAPDSFDGRYFGPLNVAHVLGVGRAIWTR